MKCIYNFAIFLYAAAVRAASPFHKKANLMIRGHKDVFKKLEKAIDPKTKYFWFHAASLGEYEQGKTMIESIRKKYSDYKLLITFFSPSGYEVVKKQQDPDRVISYLPFDFPRNAKKFIEIAHPSIAIFIKYEFWMNYLNILKEKEIPTYIISAKFRPDQVFFKPLAGEYRNILRNYNRLFVQDEASFQLLKKYHIDNVSVYGDTRFDRVYEIYEQRKELPLIEQFLKRKKENEYILVAGSSWPKDEELLLDYFNNNKNLKLILAPHEIHKEHLRFIVSKLKRPYSFYSGSQGSDPWNADCLIIDCFGLLSSVYRYGDIAYIGGGFGVGIHNLLEAAVYSIPVIFGPNYKNFNEAVELIENKGGISVNDKRSFYKAMDVFIQDREKLLRYGKKAGDYVKKHRGATSVILNKIGEEIGMPPSGLNAKEKVPSAVLSQGNGIME